jgi:hypothetical protein
VISASSGQFAGSMNVSYCSKIIRSVAWPISPEIFFGFRPQTNPLVM